MGRGVVYPIILVAFALRLPDLLGPDLGMDGGWSLALSTLSRGEILGISARDVHPPLYYLLLHYWVAVVGKSALAAKLPSLGLSVAAVAVLYPLGKRLGGARAGALASFLLALSPTHVAATGLVRDFVAAVFLTALSLYCFLRMGSGIRWAAAYVLSTLAALYTSYFTVAVVGAQAIWTGVEWLRPLASLPHRGQVPTDLERQGDGGQQERARCAASLSGRMGADAHPLKPFLLLAIGYLPWILAVAGPTLEKVSGGLSPRAVDAPPVLAGAFASDLWAFLTVGEFSPLRRTPAALLYGMILLVGLVWRRRLSASPNSFLALALAASAVGLFAMVSYWGAEGLTSRYALLLLPLVLPLAGVALDRLGRASSSLLGLLVLVVAGASLLGVAGYHRRPPLPEGFWDPGGLVRFLETHTAPGDGVIFLTLEQAGYYESQVLQPRPWYYFIIGAQYLKHNVEERAERLLPEVAQRHRRVWLVRYQGGLPGSEPLVSWLNTHWFPSEGYWLKDSHVQAYLAPTGDEARSPLNADFAGRAELREAWLTPRAQPGGWVNVALVWRARAPLAKDYTVFVHLLDGQGKRWAQHDTPPSNGLAPTSRWAGGEQVEDRHGLSLPPDLPPGRYTLVVGLYAGEERLDLAGGGNSLPIGEVEVIP